MGFLKITAAALPLALLATAAPNPAPGNLAARDVPPTTFNKCSAEYKGVFDHFDIRGKGFNGEDIGGDGATLKNKFTDKCGDGMTHFSYVTGDDSNQGYEWTVDFDYPLGKKGCVGEVMKSIHGLSDGCQGPSGA